MWPRCVIPRSINLKPPGFLETVLVESGLDEAGLLLLIVHPFSSHGSAEPKGSPRGRSQQIFLHLRRTLNGPRCPEVLY